MFTIVSSIRAWRESRRRQNLLARHQRGVHYTARIAPEWGLAEVGRNYDVTNEGPFMGWPSQ
jgi:hypothetical protein